MEVDLENFKGNPLWYGELNAWYYVLNDLRDGNLFRSPLREDKRGNCVMLDGGDHYVLYDRARKRAYNFRQVHKELGFPGTAMEFMFECAKRFPELDIQAVGEGRPSTTKRDDASTKITATVRDWQPRDAMYWGRYGITARQLTAEHVYPISEIRVGSAQTTAVTDRAYCIRRGDCTKANFVDREGQDRWLSCGSPSGPYPLTTTKRNSRVAIVLKGIKDAIALSNMGAESTYFDLSEYTGSDDETFGRIRRMLLTHMRVVFVKDADDAGISFAQRLIAHAHQRGIARHISVATTPPVLHLQYGLTDPTDLIAHGYSRVVRTWLRDIQSDAHD